MKALKPLAALAAALAIAILLAAAPILAAKPGGGGGGKGGGGGGGVAPAPGTIYFDQHFDAGTENWRPETWTMDGDGSNKSLALRLPTEAYGVRFRHEFYTPSYSSYGQDGHRWWLTIGSTADGLSDLYATPDGQTWIKLTGSYIETLAEDETSRTEAVLFFNQGRPSWSNDGLDTFVSVSGTQGIREINKIDGTTTVSFLERAIFQLKISAAGLEQMLDAQEGIVQPTTDIDMTAVITTSYDQDVDENDTGAGYEENFAHHHWSPEGNKIVCLFRDQSDYLLNNPADLWMAELTDGPVDADTAEEPIFTKVFDGWWFIWGTPQWSGHQNAEDQRIIFGHDGQIHTVKPDGTEDIVVAEGARPYWSPDSQFIVFDYYEAKGPNRYYHVGRVPAAGGEIVNLTSDLDKAIDKRVVGWIE